MKIKLSNCILFFVFILLLLDVPYIKHVFNTKGYIFLFIEAIISLLLAYAYYRRPFFSVPILILLFFGIYMMLISVFNGNGVEYITNFLPIFLVCLYFSFVQGSGGITRNILKTWIIFLTVLVVLDIITIFLFPSGLYYGNVLYNAGGQRNWILGYKTNRLLYSFPLVVFYSYYLFLANKIRIRDLALFGIVFLDIYLTNATAGSFILFVFLFVAIVYIVSLQKKGKAAHFISHLLRKYRLFLIVFAFITVTITLLQANPTITRFLGSIFGKSETLSYRTSIWQICTEDIREHFFTGHGILLASQYALITGGFANPHSMILTYLLTGGFLGLLFISTYFLYCMRNAKQSDENMLFLLAVYCLLILGITSSTLSYSPFLFVFMLLMHEKHSDKKL